MNELMALFVLSLFLLQVSSMTNLTSLAPNLVPTHIPLYSSKEPTSIPLTVKPSNIPTLIPTFYPSNSPTVRPITQKPTVNPTNYPSTAKPSNMPTLIPSFYPSNSPTARPSTHTPTIRPTCIPSFTPTNIPSYSPSVVPSTIRPTKPTHERYGNGSLSNKLEAVFMLSSLLFLVIGAMYYVYLREKSRQEPKHVFIRRDEDDIQLDLELNEVDYENPWSIISYMKSQVMEMFISSQGSDNVYSSVNLNGSDDGSVA